MISTELGMRDNTIIFYIWGDNGSCAEGQHGTISELLAQNSISNTIEQQIAAMNKLGGLEALGGPKMDNMYHAGWAWAGDTPFHHTKLVPRILAARATRWLFSWPAESNPTRRRARSSITSTTSRRPSMKFLASSRPRWSIGFKQDPIDGVSMAYTFADAQRPPQADAVFRQQRQPRHLSRWLVSPAPLDRYAVAQRSPGLAALGFEK